MMPRGANLAHADEIRSQHGTTFGKQRGDARRKIGAGRVANHQHRTPPDLGRDKLYGGHAVPALGLVDEPGHAHAVRKHRRGKDSARAKPPLVDVGQPPHEP